MYYTYLLRCGDGSLYAGITTDPARRLAEHRAGGEKGARYTRFRGPLVMAALWESADRRLATRLEYRLKKAPHAVKAALIAAPGTVSAVLPGLGAGDYTPRPLPDQADAAFK
ncbi:MAG: GIY-YIG nuclease family protein [Clostridia bacterium]|nr:GIY-YIG nuclease family protein [Clostridia bacterium]